MEAPSQPIDDDLRRLSFALTTPYPGECLMCFVARQVEGFGCNSTLRWACHWRDMRVPRATALERRLEARGGFCDCEIFVNGWTLRDDLLVPYPYPPDPDVNHGPDPDDPDRDDPDLEDWDLEDWVWPSPLPGCCGVSSRSSQPCALWVALPQSWP
jgi:hypothetical protein